MNADHIALLKLNGNQNVCGGGDGENQMSNRHPWRRPEGNDEPQHDRVAHESVKQRRDES